MGARVTLSALGNGHHSAEQAVARRPGPSHALTLWRENNQQELGGSVHRVPPRAGELDLPHGPSSGGPCRRLPPLLGARRDPVKDPIDPLSLGEAGEWSKPGGGALASSPRPLEPAGLPAPSIRGSEASELRPGAGLRPLGRSQGQALGRGGEDQTRRKTSDELCPPNPKLLLSVTSTLAGRASFGTQSSGQSGSGNS